MQAGRLVELLLLLQVRRAATVGQLAESLGVSTRTIHRDIIALVDAGVPIETQTGRAGGVRLAGGYRLDGQLPFDAAEGRRLALAAVPTAARELGIGDSGDSWGTAASVGAVRDRLLIEPEPWFGATTPGMFLAEIAAAVWNTQEVRIGYTSGGQVTEDVIRPLGLILKAGTWYVLAQKRRGATQRLYRLSRMAEATVLPHRFERPEPFNLEAAWVARKRDFIASIPTYFANVRVAPAAEGLLGLLQEGAPKLPLPQDVVRDRAGWAMLTLRFERPETAARLLLQLGGGIEIIGPPELRDLIMAAARDLAHLYRRRHPRRPP